MSEFRAAFDTPTTPEQALAVLWEWGKESVMTFSCARTRAVHKLLSDALYAREAGEVRGLSSVLAELERATRKFPTWPTDPLHAVAVVGEESGELVKAVLQAVYEPHKSTTGEVRIEAIQTAAMALRFIGNLDRYQYTRGDQHHDAPSAKSAGGGNA